MVPEKVLAEAPSRIFGGLGFRDLGRRTTSRALRLYDFAVVCVYWFFVI